MQLAVKEAFFNRLQALNESSDEEVEPNIEVREVIRKCKNALIARPSPRRIRTPANVKNLPALQRAVSSPLSCDSIVKETPRPHDQQSFLLRDLTTASTSISASVVNETPPAPAASSTRPPDRRTVSTHSIGTDLILNYSTGIESMLGKRALKRKKDKEESIKLVQESERIFKDLTFYYFPPDDKTRLRKLRIQRAREFGATWAKQDWDPDVITHVIVENGYTYQGVMRHLKLDVWPSKVILVKEDYPLDCIRYKELLDSQQILYEVAGQNQPAIQGGDHETSASQTSDRSLNIYSTNPRSKNRPVASRETTPRTQQSLPDYPVGLQSGLTRSQAAGPQSKAGDGMMDNPLEPSTFELQPSKRQRLFTQRDDLDEMIAIAKGVQHLPLDDDEEEEETDTSRPSSCADTETSDSENSRPLSRNAPKPTEKGGNAGGLDPSTFTCMQGGTGFIHGANPNARTIEVLQEMLEYYERTRDRWRSFAYKRALSTLKKQTTRIRTYDQALELPTIGHRLALKIEEIFLTNHLRRLENAKLEPTDQVLTKFMNIYGVGINQAWKWVLQGHKTLEDLVQRVHLTENQRIGIEKYDDLLKCIPRDEVTTLGEFVKQAAAKLDPEVEVIIGGSYRRGVSSSGDFDCLLTKPGTRASRDLLPFVNQLVAHLTSTGFLVAALAVPSERGSASKWHGCCVLPRAEKQIWRRIDFLLVPATELGAALIYFTGDDIFNRSMRLLSSKKGWRLNQRGLYKDCMWGAERVKATEGTLMVGDDEEKIFQMLGVPFRPPHQRICQ